MGSTFNNFFDKIYVITCLNFYDRQFHIKNHFAKNLINFEFFVSVDKNVLIDGEKISSTEKSLALSHLNCVMNAKLNGYNSILICEDDVNFLENINERFDEFLKILPNDWNFIQLGNQFWATDWLIRTFISDNLYEFKWGTGSHCIGINSNIYDSVINDFKNLNNPTDIMYYNLFSKHKCYCPKLFLADALSKSDQLNYPDKKYIFKSTIHHKNI
jgi:GR25 family glycosyltransferase involved in LPS biosynthesis